MLKLKLFLGTSLLAYGMVCFDNLFLSNRYADFEKIIPIRMQQSSGKEIYTDFCIQCHAANGKGDGKNFPPLDNSDYLKTKRVASIYAVKYGQSGQIIVNKKKYNGAMPPMGLSNQEVADVMNYVMTSWSNKQTKVVTEQEVAAVKK